MEWFWSTVDWLKPHVPSATILVSTAITGAMGAYFGAVGAQRAINKDAQLREKFEKISTVNAAHSLTVEILNHAAGLKKQTYLPMLKQFQLKRNAALSAIERSCATIHVELDLQSLPPAHFPLRTLEAQLYGKLGLNGRPLAAMAQLVQAEHTLHMLMDTHEPLRIELGHDPDLAAVRYLAISTEGGVDSRYSDLCQSLVSTADDLMFFSDILAEDLLEYGKTIRAKASKRERRHLPSTNSPTKLLPGSAYSLPNRDNYQSWLKGYIVEKASGDATGWRRFLRGRTQG